MALIGRRENVTGGMRAGWENALCGGTGYFVSAALETAVLKLGWPRPLPGELGWALPARRARADTDVSAN